MPSSSPCVIMWASVVLAALVGCERATPSAGSPSPASAAPQQVSAPLLPRASEVARQAESAGATAGAGGAQAEAPSAGAGGSGPAEQRPASGARALQPRASSGASSETCINGWLAPGRGNPLRRAALDMIRARKSERFVVVEMRYFRGPEDAEVIGPQREVERWYVKAYSTGRDARRQRWLLRRAEVGRGIDAVAEFDSTGYAPGTWQRPDASDDSVSDPFQRPCDRQSAGEKCMGLPYAVLGCLDGT